MVKLVVGLGNPDRHYTHNRHNVGFMCVERFARRHSISISQRQSRSRVGAGEFEGIEVVVARPQTYMNLSGEALAALCKKHRVELEDVLVVCDDLDLALGRIRLRAEGSAGGHNGLKSIIASLGTRDFARLRIGIGRPGECARESVVDYVLGDFSRDEREVLEEVLDRAADAVDCWVKYGIGAAMNRFNAGVGNPKSEVIQ